MGAFRRPHKLTGTGAIAALLLLVSGCDRGNSDAPVVAATMATKSKSAPAQSGPTQSSAEEAPDTSSVPPPESDAEAQLRTAIGRDDSPHISQPDTTLRPYVDAGLITARPDVEADYYRYFRVRKPTRFLGYPLLAFKSEEMRGAWIGCCLNAGLSMLVKTEGRDAAAQAFAAENGCRLFGPGNWRMDYFLELGVPGFTANGPDYRLISCHDWDASESAG